ncbi:LysR family transcriptional regulator [Burkholderia stagnalis]
MIPSLNTIMGRLHAKQLRLLHALGTHGSLLHAAREVSLSQPGASKALREIESIFGVELFTRTNRGLEPNDAGHCVIRYARLFESDITNLREELISVLRGRGARVSVGTIMGAVPLLTDAITALLAEQPDMSIEVVDESSAALLELLDQGRIDIVLGRSNVGRVPAQYQRVAIHEEKLMVIASVQHLLTRKKTVRWDDLSDTRWIVYRANTPIRRSLEREFNDAGARMPVHPVETTSAFTIMSLLQKSDGFVTILPTEIAQFCIENGWARKLAIRVKSRSLPYEMITRPGAPLSPGTQLMMQTIARLAHAELPPAAFDVAPAKR